MTVAVGDSGVRAPCGLVLGDLEETEPANEAAQQRLASFAFTEIERIITTLSEPVLTATTTDLTWTRRSSCPWNRLLGPLPANSAPPRTASTATDSDHPLSDRTLRAVSQNVCPC